MQETDKDMQTQQLYDADPVNIQITLSQEAIDMKASNWVNSHFLELWDTYGLAFELFEKETIVLLMNIDERKSLVDNRRPNLVASTPKSRGIGKNELKNLKSSLNEEVEGNRGRNFCLNF